MEERGWGVRALSSLMIGEQEVIGTVLNGFDRWSIKTADH